MLYILTQKEIHFVYDISRQPKCSKEVKRRLGTRHGSHRKVHQSAQIHLMPQPSICLLNCVSYSKEHKVTNEIQQLPLQFQPALPNKNRRMTIQSLILIHVSITMCPSKHMKVPRSILTLNVWCSCASKAVTSSCKVMTSRNCPQRAIRSEQSWARFIFISSASSSGFSIFWSQEKIFTWFTDETIMYRQQ